MSPDDVLGELDAQAARLRVALASRRQRGRRSRAVRVVRAAEDIAALARRLWFILDEKIEGDMCSVFDLGPTAVFLDSSHTSTPTRPFFIINGPTSGPWWIR